MSEIAEEAQKRRELKHIIDVEEKKAKLVIFTLSGAYYAFYSKDAKEILFAPKIFPIPGLPDYIPGVIDVRDDLLPVTDIKILVGLEKTGTNRIVIVEELGICSGILVDSVEDVLDVPVSSIRQSTTTQALGVFAAEETAYNQNRVALLNIEKLFAKITAEDMNHDSPAAEINNTEIIQFLIFSMADLYFGVDMEQIEEILDPPPGADMNEIPALHEILSFHTTGAAYRDPKILFIRSDSNKACAIKIDGVKNMADISINAIQPIPPLLGMNSKTKAVWGATFMNEDLVLLLDLYEIPWSTQDVSS